ncbi:MAG TPA: purine-nucleoside phosphorylase [Clostridiaceae bacterium]|nr:purine-nucleoside phosphorylase [Clostridiaceae bacterium]
MNKAAIAAEYIRNKIDFQPEIGIILGSGLGSLADKINDAVAIDYNEIPGFPHTTVEGHTGKLILGSFFGRLVAAMKGRFHYYEGYDINQVVFGIRVFKFLGIGSILVTNASGGINENFKPGDLMIISDHISFFSPSPLRGINEESYGKRFPDMCNTYDKDLREIARKSAEELSLDIKEGVYAFTQGPMYETPAEIRALRILGADAVGMSTVPEVIAARHSGMKVLGVSCITNMAAGIGNNSLNHEEVIKTAGETEQKFTMLVSKIMENWKM